MSEWLCRYENLLIRPLKARWSRRPQIKGPLSLKSPDKAQVNSLVNQNNWKFDVEHVLDKLHFGGRLIKINQSIGFTVTTCWAKIKNIFTQKTSAKFLTKLFSMSGPSDVATPKIEVDIWQLITKISDVLRLFQHGFSGTSQISFLNFSFSCVYSLQRDVVS